MTDERKIRIALSITELMVGGAEKAMTELVTGLDRNRFDPVLYVLRSRSYHDSAPSFIPILEERGIPLRFLDFDSPCRFFRVLYRFQSLLREQNADIFQSFMFHANFLGRLAARSAGIPVVLSGIRVSEKEHPTHRILDRLTSHSVDRYVCVSRSVAEFTEKIGRIPRRKIDVIPNAIDPDPELGIMRFFPTASSSSLPEGFESIPPKPEGEKRILFVGRLTRQKGLLPLLQRAGEWLQAPECDGWSFWIVGDGDLRKDLLRIKRNLPEVVAKKIHFTGWRPDISHLLSDADLFLLPSRYEGMPNVLLEAATSGLPILSSSSDGVEEILGDLTENQTFTFGDWNGFRKKLFPLLSDPLLRRRLGDANRNRVLNEFSVSKMISRYQDLWLSELATHQNRKEMTKNRK